MNGEHVEAPCQGTLPEILDRFTLEQSVQAAGRLLAYAASQGLKLEEEVIQKIVESCDLLCVKTNDAATFPQQVAFWIAYDKLTRAVQPVTTESIEAITLALPRRGFCVRLRETLLGPLRASDKAIRRYKFWAFVALVFVLLLQAYWGVGSRLNAQATDLLGELVKINATPSGDKGAKVLVESIKSELELRATSLQEWNIGWQSVLKHWPHQTDETLTSATKEQPTATKEHTDVVQERGAAPPAQTVGQQGATTPAQTVGQQGATTPEPTIELQNAAAIKEMAKATLALRKARLDTTLALEVIALYILPLLFGWLGSCLFVLRSLSKEIGAVSYTTEEDMVYRIRLFTGALAGLVVGGFGLLQDKTSPLASLTPFALAFIAGYSVDLFIACMDKIIATFTTKEDLQKT